MHERMLEEAHRTRDHAAREIVGLQEEVSRLQKALKGSQTREAECEGALEEAQRFARRVCSALGDAEGALEGAERAVSSRVVKRAFEDLATARCEVDRAKGEARGERAGREAAEGRVAALEASLRAIERELRDAERRQHTFEGEGERERGRVGMLSARLGELEGGVRGALGALEATAVGLEAALKVMGPAFAVREGRALAGERCRWRERAERGKEAANDAVGRAKAETDATKRRNEELEKEVVSLVEKARASEEALAEAAVVRGGLEAKVGEVASLLAGTREEVVGLEEALVRAEEEAMGLRPLERKASTLVHALQAAHIEGDALRHALGLAEAGLLAAQTAVGASNEEVARLTGLVSRGEAASGRDAELVESLRADLEGLAGELIEALGRLRASETAVGALEQALECSEKAHCVAEAVLEALGGATGEIGAAVDALLSVVAGLKEALSSKEAECRGLDEERTRLARRVLSLEAEVDLFGEKVEANEGAMVAYEGALSAMMLKQAKAEEDRCANTRLRPG